MSTVIDTAKIQADLNESLDRNCKTFATREPSARVWGFETQVDPTYGRTQRRYIGTSGNVEHTDPGALMGASFTAGQVHAVRNDGDDNAFFQVMLGNPTPDRPKYMDPELRRLQKIDRPDEAVRVKG